MGIAIFKKKNKTLPLKNPTVAIPDFAKPEVFPQAYVIKEIIKACGYTSYLELGVFDGGCYNYIRDAVEFANAVDITFNPNIAAKEFFQMTTDQFFAQNNKGYDTIFIDACHEYGFVKRDFLHSERALNPGGIIFLHDTDPCSEAYAQPEYCGTAYKILKDLRERDDLDIMTIPLDVAGLTMVRRKQDLRQNNFIK